MTRRSIALFIGAAFMMGTVVALAVVPADAAAQKKKRTAKKKQAKGAENLDPYGRPQGKLVSKSGRYYVWVDKQGWHVITTAMRLRKFDGTISIKRGRIESAVAVGLDNKKEAWKLNGARDKLEFTFSTGRKADGFYFKVNRETPEITFDLHFRGNPIPARQVFIGRDLKHPRSVPFTLKNTSRPRRATTASPKTSS